MRRLDKNIEQRSVTRKDLLDLRGQLEAIERSGIVQKAFVGFDGFVDKIQKAVKKKSGGNNLFFNTIQEFSKHIESLAGCSGQIELVTTKTKAGGNAPILSAALAELNVETTCVGAMGFPAINPLFKTNASSTEFLSINEPGKSQAIEFNDGKIILSEFSSFTNYNWSYIKENTDIEKLRSAVKSCDVVALVDWSNLPNATEIWQGLHDDVIKVVNRKDLHFLFDLCDPSRKDPIEIDEMLDLISSFSNYGNVTLAINENEARKICIALTGCDQGVKSNYFPTLMEIGSFIYYTTTINTLLIHPIDRTLVFQENKTLELSGRLVKEPKVQTGGGDNFNAGYCLGLINGLPMEQCVLLAIITAGAYVQNGKSPRIKDLINYIDNWANEIEMSRNQHELATTELDETKIC